MTSTSSARATERRTASDAGISPDGTTCAPRVLSGVVPSGSLHTRRSLRALARVVALAQESERFTSTALSTDGLLSQSP